VAFFWLCKRGNVFRNAIILILAAGLIAPAGHAFADGTVEGNVELPKPHTARLLNHRYRSDVEVPEAPTDPPIAVVYLTGEGVSRASGGATQTAVMAQKNAMFDPELLPVQVGTAVDFPNLDDMYHNVFSYSKTKRFDLGRYRKSEKAASVLFDRPGVVVVHCEIHERMLGTILVLDTPYFQKTDATGRYRLEHVPAGRYTLKAWISDNDVRERAVELSSGARLHVDLPAK
jgi:plastocyanin